MAMGKPKNNGATTDADAENSDEALWRRVAGTIKPLKSRRPPPSSAAPAASPAAAAPPAKPRAAAAPSAKPPLPDLAPSATPGLDKRTAQRLGRGLLAIDARIDLHGLTQDAAHARLSGFIRRAVASGHRCVLVITGKGYKPTGEVGVLRRSVPRWLNEPDLRRDIVALRHAQPKDGGEGALYVLLKRDRTAVAAGKDATPPKRLTRVRRS
jgi:DNA-nicking Smr family endonuclease